MPETMTAPLKLNIGCGAKRIEGEVGVDAYPTEAADVIAEMTDLPYDPGTVDQVRLEHVLEHLPYRKVPTALAEMRRVLKPGGRIIVGVPDIEATFRAYLDATDAPVAVARATRYAALRHVYGSQTAEGQYHQSGWDSDSLRDLLLHSGFYPVEVRVDTERGDMFGGIVAEGVKA